MKQHQEDYTRETRRMKLRQFRQFVYKSKGQFFGTFDPETFAVVSLYHFFASSSCFRLLSRRSFSSFMSYAQRNAVASRLRDTITITFNQWAFRTKKTNLSFVKQRFMKQVSWSKFRELTFCEATFLRCRQNYYCLETKKLTMNTFCRSREKCQWFPLEYTSEITISFSN